MRVEFSFTNPDEMSLGLFLAYGEEEMGSNIHITTVGLIFFEINFITYLKE